MKKLMSLFVLALVIATLPLMAAAKQGPAVEVVGDNATQAAIPSGYSAGPVPEVLLYDNGPMVTHPGGGFNGADASALQSALLMNTYGFGHQWTLNYWMADDFAITDPFGWDLEAIQFFAYQTGTYTIPPASTMTGVYYEIYNGQPGAGGVLVCGDLVTNKMTATGWTNIYRVLDTGLLANNRPIMEDTVGIHGGCTHLDPGTYWIMWASTGNLASGPWAPPITILGQTTTGNAMQSLDGGATWNPALDTGSGTQQGMPFRIFGTVTQPPQCSVHLYRTKINWMYTARPGYVKSVFSGIVHDQDHNLVPGATVTGHWIINNVAQPPATYVTTPLGQFKFPWKGPWATPGWYDFCVDNIQYGNCVYDYNANEAPACRIQDIPPP